MHIECSGGLALAAGGEHTATHTHLTPDTTPQANTQGRGRARSGVASGERVWVPSACSRKHRGASAVPTRCSVDRRARGPRRGLAGARPAAAGVARPPRPPRARRGSCETCPGPPRGTFDTLRRYRGIADHVKLHRYTAHGRSPDSRYDCSHSSAARPQMSDVTAEDEST